MTESKLKQHLVIILDQSGSMYNLKQFALDSVNEQIQTAKAHDDEFDVHVTLILFNYDIHIIKSCAPINDLDDLTESDYAPTGGTALNDAIGVGIDEIERIEDDLKGIDVLFTIVSDGYENQSNKYPGRGNSELAERIQTMTGKFGWTFTYLGTKHDVSQAAGALNITNTMEFADADLGLGNQLTGLNNHYATRSFEMKKCRKSGVDLKCMTFTSNASFYTNNADSSDATVNNTIVNSTTDDSE